MTGTLFFGMEEKSGNGSSSKEVYGTDKGRVYVVGGSLRGGDERAAYSDLNRPVIPKQTGYPFRSKPATATEQFGHPVG